MTHVTCRLTAKNRDQLGNSTLGSRVRASFHFTGIVEARLEWLLWRGLRLPVGGAEQMQRVQPDTNDVEEQHQLQQQTLASGCCRRPTAPSRAVLVVACRANYHHRMAVCVHLARYNTTDYRCATTPDL